MTVFYWLVLFILLIIVELGTLQLVSLWFACGSLAGLVILQLGGSIEAQLIGFLLVSFVLLILVKGHQVKTNVDSLIGKTAKVIKQINGPDGRGVAVVNGLEWTAVAYDDSVFEEGTYVTIREISGVKMIVEAKAEEV